MRMREPQAPQVRGSASKILLIKRAQVLRASLAKSELSRAWGAGLGRGSGGAGAAGLLACAGDSAAVGIRAAKTLAVACRIRDMGGNAVDPLERIEDQQGGAGARAWGCLQGQPPAMHLRSEPAAFLRYPGYGP